MRARSVHKSPRGVDWLAMARLVLAGVLAAAGFALAPSAAACDIDTSCPVTPTVCSQVSCHVCYYKPEGARECIV